MNVLEIINARLAARRILLTLLQDCDAPRDPKHLPPQ